MWTGFVEAVLGLAAWEGWSQNLSAYTCESLSSEDEIQQVNQARGRHITKH